MSTIKIICKDDQEIEVDIELANLVPLFASTIEESGADEPIPIASLSKQCVEWVVGYLTLVKDGGHPEIEKPLTSEDLAEAISDEKFLDLIKDREAEDLFEMATGGVTLGLH